MKKVFENDAFVICHDGCDHVHPSKVSAGTVLESGQPHFEEFEDEESWRGRLSELGVELPAAAGGPPDLPAPAAAAEGRAPEVPPGLLVPPIPPGAGVPGIPPGLVVPPLVPGADGSPVPMEPGMFPVAPMGKGQAKVMEIRAKREAAMAAKADQ